jgi:hypothetical protein
MVSELTIIVEEDKPLQHLVATVVEAPHPNLSIAGSSGCCYCCQSQQPELKDILESDPLSNNKDDDDEYLESVLNK